MTAFGGVGGMGGVGVGWGGAGAAAGECGVADAAGGGRGVDGGGGGGAGAVSAAVRVCGARHGPQRHHPRCGGAPAPSRVGAGRVRRPRRAAWAPGE